MFELGAKVRLRYKAQPHTYPFTVDATDGEHCRLDDGSWWHSSALISDEEWRNK